MMMMMMMMLIIECLLLLLQAVYISRVNEDGPAAIDGKLAIGDRIVSVSFNFIYLFKIEIVHESIQRNIKVRS